MRLRRMSLATGEVADLLTLDSDTFPAQPGFVARQTGDCTGEPDFDGNAFFVEVEISKTSAAARPALASIKLLAEPCPP